MNYVWSFVISVFSTFVIWAMGAEPESLKMSLYVDMMVGLHLWLAYFFGK